MPKGSAPFTASSISADLRRGHGLPEERQSQLKLLIARGKEQGYLTYAQVNDHLPSEIVDPEQIEDIVNMINDMGIPVYEKAPDTESLLATEPSPPADEEAIEEAAAALAALDAELGRTTDPVRMYMREMGTVELLTREGEIRIAKRIEEGLEAVRIALAQLSGHLSSICCAPTSPSRPARRAWSTSSSASSIRTRPTSSRSRRTRPRSSRRSAKPRPRTKRTPRTATRPKKRPSTPARIRKKPRAASARSPSCMQQALARIDKLGVEGSEDAEDPQEALPTSSWSSSSSPRMFDALIDNLRTHVTEVRQLEKEIMVICVRDAGMPRKDFISTFPKNETSTALARQAHQGRQEVLGAAGRSSRTRSSGGRTS